MRKLIIAALAVFAIHAQADTERWAVVGDTVQGLAYEDQPYTDANLMWPALSQGKTGHLIHNMSSGSGWKMGEATTALRIEAAKALGVNGVILSLGMYDWQTGQNLSAIRANIMTYIAGLKSAGLKVVCLTPIYRNDWNTRKGPNPGQVSARGNPLFTNPANPGVPGYANLMASYCSMAGAQVIVGRSAPFGLSSMGPLNSFTRYLLTRASHHVMADFVVSKMRALGHWQ